MEEEQCMSICCSSAPALGHVVVLKYHQRLLNSLVLKVNGEANMGSEALDTCSNRQVTFRCFNMRFPYLQRGRLFTCPGRVALSTVITMGARKRPSFKYSHMRRVR